MSSHRLFAVAATVVVSAFACSPTIDLGGESLAAVAVAVTASASATGGVSGASVTGPDLAPSATTSNSTGGGVAGCTKPASIATVTPIAAAITADASAIYAVTGAVGWPSGEATIRRVPLDGSPGADLVTNVTVPLALAVDATNLYWVDGANVNKSVIGSGTFTSIAATPSFGARILVHGSDLFWADADETKIERTTITGGVVTTVFDSGAGAIRGLAADDQNLYFTGRDASGSESVIQMPIAGGPATTLASDDVNVPYEVGAIDGFVFWVTPGTTEANGSLLRVPIGGGTVDTISSTDCFYSMVLAVNNGRVCWGGGAIDKTATMFTQCPIEASTVDGLTQTAPDVATTTLGGLVACGTGFCWVDAQTGSVRGYSCTN